MSDGYDSCNKAELRERVRAAARELDPVLRRAEHLIVCIIDDKERICTTVIGAVEELKIMRAHLFEQLHELNEERDIN